jgi:hypothetical protein
LHASTDRGRRTRRLAACLLATLAFAALPIPPALAGSGGTGTRTGGGGGGGGGKCTHHRSARLRNGEGIPPCRAPHRVQSVMRAANEIDDGHGYCLGGGHGSWKSSCYDCSGAVSYALHGGRLLRHPLDSSGLARWGGRGKGHWITVYGNSGHAFMTIAGLRFDTSDTAGNGPGWARTMGYERPSQYAHRHKGRL